MKSSIPSLFFFIFALISPFSSLAEEIYVPEELKPWVPWVEQKNPERNCAWRKNSPSCVFPGSLNYTLSQNRADFLITAELLSAGEVSIPASKDLIPQGLEVKDFSNKLISAPLRSKKNKLVLKLPQGKFTISGYFQFQSPPLELPIPKEIGIWKVEVNGLSNKERFHRKSGKLYKLNTSRDKEVDSVNIKIFRKIKDDSPLKIETILTLKVSGSSRPFEAGNILPRGAIPILIESPLPYYLNSEGELAIQLAPGEHQISLNSVLQQPVSKIELPSLAKNSFFPDKEIILVQDNPRFRSVEILGPVPIAKSAVEIPKEIAGGAIYSAKAGSLISFREVRRGMLKPADNSIYLNRNLWVDLFGKGFTVLDNISGTMNKGFRLNALADTKLGRVDIAGQPLLINKDPEASLWGIEVEEQQLNLQAVSRYEGSRSIPAVGWDFEASNLSLNLNLPPSWKLITVSGASNSTGAWLDSWTLLQIFLSFLIILASFKLIGPAFSAAIALCIIVNHGEFLAPGMLYIHLLLLVVWDRLILNKDSIYSSVCNILLAATFIVLSIHSFAFAKLQFTQLLFPQLQAGTRYRSFLQEIFFTLNNEPLFWPLIIFILGLLILWLVKITKSGGLKSFLLNTIKFGCIGFVGLSLFFAYMSLPRTNTFSGPPLPGKMDSMNRTFKEMGYPQSTVAAALPARDVRKKLINKSLASGPAIPDWLWRSHTIQIDSPVAANHQLKFYILSQNFTRILCAIRVALVLFILFYLFKTVFKTGSNFLSSLLEKSFALKNGLSILFLIALFSFRPSILLAEVPSTELLKELEQKLDNSICKSKDCLSLNSVKIEASSKTLRLKLKVHSSARSLVTIPGRIGVLVPTSVTLNGSPYSRLLVSDDYLLIQVDPGIHDIEVFGKTPDSNAFSLSFPENPVHVQVESDHWFVEGISNAGAIKGDLRFTAKRQTSGDESSDPGSPHLSKEIDLPGYTTVARQIFISEEIHLNTKVHRHGDVSREKLVLVPLLPGENITSGPVKLDGQKLSMNFGPREKSKSYSSIISRSEKNWALKASSMPSLSEEWAISCASLLNCKYSGLKPTRNSQNGKVVRIYHPFPDEELQIDLVELEAIKGEFMTVDSLNHSVSWGSSTITGSVNIAARVTKQRNLNFELEEGFEIKSLSLGGNIQSGVYSGSKGDILLSPGIHNVNLRYKIPAKPSFFEKVPALKINSAANNIRTELQPGKDRLILWMGGPYWGPCIVFWSKLIVFIAICLMLSRLGLIPLSIPSSILLGLGLASLPVIRFWIPLLWLSSIVLLQRTIPTIRQSSYRKPVVALFCLLVFVSIFVLYEIVMCGLVLQPPMLIAGNNSSSSAFKWYVDRSSGDLLQPWVISLPIGYWRAVAIVWSFWLVTALFAWLKLSVERIKQLLA